jgi:CDP-glycerol glycerophosphotransferase (TagB/SpsB family)
MLDFAKQNPEIDIVLRPHPFLWGTLTDRKVLTVAELSSWRANWNALPNTYVDEDGSYAELFLATDVLVTDGISFLGEYPLVTGKPTIFFENEGHWEFSPTGKLAAATSVKVRTFEELKELLAVVKLSGLPDRSEQIQKLIEASSPYPGDSAKRIVKIVYDDFDNGPSPLVSKSTISATPWELAAGREPFED